MEDGERVSLKCLISQSKYIMFMYDWVMERIVGEEVLMGTKLLPTT